MGKVGNTGHKSGVSDPGAFLKAAGCWETKCCRPLGKLLLLSNIDEPDRYQRFALLACQPDGVDMALGHASRPRRNLVSMHTPSGIDHALPLQLDGNR